MKVHTAQIGFCFGIERAYGAMNEHALEAPIHVAHRAGGEWDTLRRIERRDPELLNRYPGLERVTVAHDTAKLSSGDRLVLGFHGLAQNTKDQLVARGVDLRADMLCPFIAKLDRIVERLVGEGFDIAIVGKKDNHHCKVAQELAERHGRRCYVIERPEEISAIPQDDGRRLALVGQVTGNTVVFDEVIARVRNAEIPMRIFRTMCGDSRTRQHNAAELAKAADVVVVVDDDGGAAQSVLEVCTAHNKRVHKVSAKNDVELAWFDGANTVAVIGGILVPEWTIEDIAQHLRDLVA
jgi:4-hydroxy-3-methylbut-2-enyl diphosphate reductase